MRIVRPWSPARGSTSLKVRRIPGLMIRQLRYRDGGVPTKRMAEHGYS